MIHFRPVHHHDHHLSSATLLDDHQLPHDVGPALVTLLPCLRPLSPDSSIHPASHAGVTGGEGVVPTSEEVRWLEHG